MINEIVGDQYGDARAESSIPDLEAVKAFALDFRFFIQDGDRISFRVLGEIYQNIPVPEKFKVTFSRQRTDFNELLNRPSMVFTQHGRLTFRQVIDTVLYGQLVHFNHKHLYDELINEPRFEALLMYAFNHALREAMNCIARVRDTNNFALQELRAQLPRTGTQYNNAMQPTNLLTVQPLLCRW